MCAVLLIIFKRTVLLGLLVAGSSLVFLTATTGRTAPITALAWGFFTYLYWRKMHTHSPLTLSRSVLFGAALCGVIVTFFVTAGNWLGKSLTNSGLIGYTLLGDRTNTLTLPYLYLTASIPSLDKVLAGPPEYTLGAQTFLPVTKIASMILGFEAPREILPFVDTPFSNNTYTFLYPYYMDFGFAGIVAGPFVVGLLTMYANVALMQRKMFLTGAVMCAWLAKCIFMSFGTNHFASPFTWGCLAFSLILDRTCVTFWQGYVRDRIGVPHRHSYSLKG